MDSVIFQGPNAIAAARHMAQSLGTAAFDLGPDFGQDTARVYLRESVQNLVEVVEGWKLDGWFNITGTDFRVVFDGPPFRMGGIPSVEGTPL